MRDMSGSNSDKQALETLVARLSEPLRETLVVFKRLGGQGTIADVRKATGAPADPHAKKHIKQGLMRRGNVRDFYELTPQGHAAANLIITQRR